MKKRSKYRPRPVQTNPLLALAPVDRGTRALLLARCHSALSAMQFGRLPGIDEWSDLAGAVNIVDTLAMEQGKLVPEEILPVLNEAQGALVRVSNRYKQGLGMRVDAVGLEALRDVLDVYGQCLAGFTAREMADAIALTKRRVDEAGRKSAPTEEAACA